MPRLLQPVPIFVAGLAGVPQFGWGEGDHSGDGGAGGDFGGGGDGGGGS